MYIKSDVHKCLFLADFLVKNNFIRNATIWNKRSYHLVVNIKKKRILTNSGTQ